MKRTWKWGGYTSPHPTRRYGKRRELSYRGPQVGAPAENGFSVILSPQIALIDSS